VGFFSLTFRNNFTVLTPTPIHSQRS
jgi:hypothetical protein